MNVRQLEEFIGSGDQRVFHILTVTHLYGGIAGTVGGAWFLQPFLGIWAFFLGGTLGLASTWKRSGRPLYGWALAYVRFVLRGLFKMGDACVDSAQYYVTHRVRSAPYMVMRSDGSVVMVNRGSGASDDPLDRLIVMPSPSPRPSGTGISTRADTLRGRSSTKPVLPDQSASPTGYNAATSVATATEVFTPISQSWADTGNAAYESGSLPEHREEATPPRRKEADIAAWGLD